MMQEANNDVAAYRQEILDILLNTKDEEGNPRLTPKEAQYLAKEFSDEELIDGMPWNTPQEVADMLLDSGI